jgi:metal-dependent HD superfamily phosphatase/phosphodiesterase
MNVYKVSSLLKIFTVVLLGWLRSNYHGTYFVPITAGSALDLLLVVVARSHYRVLVCPSP